MPPGAGWSGKMAKAREVVQFVDTRHRTVYISHTETYLHTHRSRSTRNHPSTSARRTVLTFSIARRTSAAIHTLEDSFADWLNQVLSQVI